MEECILKAVLQQAAAGLTVAYSHVGANSICYWHCKAHIWCHLLQCTPSRLSACFARAGKALMCILQQNSTLNMRKLNRYQEPCCFNKDGAYMQKRASDHPLGSEKSI